MYQGNRILALIPARSGSKGLKDKNIRLLNGFPLLAHSILQTTESGLCDCVYLSTDSERYAAIGRKYGAETPFLRPCNLAEDASLAEDYIVYTLREFMLRGINFDYFVLLQPTSPLRTSEDISSAIKLAVDHHLVSVVSVCEADHPLEYFNTLEENLNLYQFNKDNRNRQVFPTYYRVNGAIYICKCEEYLQNQDFYGRSSKAYIMDKQRSIDIDTEFDLSLSEFLLKNQ